LNCYLSKVEKENEKARVNIHRWFRYIVFLYRIHRMKPWHSRASCATI
jgi:hypothetical protein